VATTGTEITATVGSRAEKKQKLQLFLKTLARDASWEKFLRDHQKLAYR